MAGFVTESGANPSMPSLSPQRLVESITDAFAEAGAAAVLVSDMRVHPRRFHVASGQISLSLWVYLWTLTHGGGAARPRDEYRVQLTGVTPPLPQNPDGATILIGYEPNLNCFAGFDLAKHQTFSQRSPSIQININALRLALRDGLAFTRKGNDEIAIAFRPDHILSYAVNSDALHMQGADATMSDLLTRVSHFAPIPEAEIASLPVERQRIVATVSRLSRENDFRRKVIVAYDRRCAVTGLQLRLVDAAHILPVGAEGSNDEVTNGIALSPTYHRAYDQGLIYLSENFEMRINPVKEREMVHLHLHGGLEQFKQCLGHQILLPPDRRQWPAAQCIARANAFRGT
jgi:putative restriction endonuclease